MHFSDPSWEHFALASKTLPWLSGAWSKKQWTHSFSPYCSYCLVNKV